MSEHLPTKATGTPAINRRDLLKGAGGVAAGGLGAAAISKRSAFAAPAFLQNEPVTLRYMTWFWNEPGRAEAWRFMIEKFHQSQTEIRIEEGGAPFAEFTNNVIVQLQAGGVEGDLIQTTPDLVLRLLRAEQLEPLQDVVDSLGITDLSSAHDYITVDGQVHGLDVVTVVFGLLYNQALFEQDGVALPTTVEEWIEVSTQLTKRPDQFGIFSDHLLAQAEEFWFTLQEWAMPYDGVWAVGKEPQVTSEPILNALTLFKTMYDNAFPQGVDNATATQLWANGQIAQQLIVSAAVNVYKTENPELYPDIQSMTLPWESKKSIARIHPITVNANGENKDAAKEFVKFLYTPENYRDLLTKQLDVIPAYGVGGLDDYYADLHWLSPGYENINYTTPPDIMGDFIFNNQEFGQVVLTRFQEVLTQNRPVEDAMADAQQELEALAERIE
jgi:ABC-type glycerol-3-phosphate transport system substrate-binding protein